MSKAFTQRQSASYLDGETLLMTQLSDARVKIVKLIELLRSSGGLLIDVDIEESAGPDPSGPSPIAINLSGEDASLFVRNNGELFKALHQVAAAALGLDGPDHDLLWFDVDHLRANHQRHMQRLADSAVAVVRETHRPRAFDPMPSCERHMLHQALASSGLSFASEGEGPDRRVVLYPEEFAPRHSGPLSMGAPEPAPPA